MLMVEEGTQIIFNDGKGMRTWRAEEHALSVYKDYKGPTLFISEVPIEGVFAEATKDGTLTIRAVATVEGETSDGGGIGKVGVPGEILGSVKIEANKVYEEA